MCGLWHYVLKSGPVPKQPNLLRGILLFRKFETDVRARTESHETQKGCAEIQHHQLASDRNNKDDSEDNSPCKHLKAVEAQPVGIAQNINEESFCCRRCHLGRDLSEAVVDSLYSGGLSVDGGLDVRGSRASRRRGQLRLKSGDLSLHSGLFARQLRLFG